MRTTIELTSAEHKKLKVICSILGITLKDYVRQCLKDHLDFSEIPNSELLQDFKDTDEGKDLIDCDSLEDMFNKLGI